MQAKILFERAKSHLDIPSPHIKFRHFTKREDVWVGHVRDVRISRVAEVQDRASDCSFALSALYFQPDQGVSCLAFFIVSV